jgi:hypothetical protein
MRTKRDLMRLLMVGAALAGAASLAAAQAPSGDKPDTLRWSATTYQAANLAEFRKVLDSGRRVRVSGEVVDVSCYLQLGKHGAAHTECATKCANNGQPLGLLTAGHTLYFLFPEEHHPRRDGQAEIRTTMIPLMGKTVSVAGTATVVRGMRGLFLKGADLAEVTVQ